MVLEHSMAIERLSPRVLSLIADGCTDKEIALKLSPPVTVNTAKSYVRTVLAKLGVATRTEAAVRFVRETRA